MSRAYEYHCLTGSFVPIVIAYNVEPLIPATASSPEEGGIAVDIEIRWVRGGELVAEPDYLDDWSAVHLGMDGCELPCALYDASLLEDIARAGDRAWQESGDREVDG